MLLNSSNVHYLKAEDFHFCLTASEKEDQWEKTAKKGKTTVCDLINSYYTKGHNSGLIEGRNSGLIEGHNSGLIEGRNQVIQALISNCKDLGCSFENTLDRIKNSLSLSDDEALEDMKLYW